LIASSTTAGVNRFVETSGYRFLHSVPAAACSIRSIFSKPSTSNSLSRLLKEGQPHLIAEQLT
jgi:hypothetical protein